jgi:hypothetical protein
MITFTYVSAVDGICFCPKRFITLGARIGQGQEFDHKRHCKIHHLEPSDEAGLKSELSLQAETELRLAQADYDKQLEITKLLMEGLNAIQVDKNAVAKVNPSTSFKMPRVHPWGRTLATYEGSLGGGGG